MEGEINRSSQATSNINTSSRHSQLLRESAATVEDPYDPSTYKNLSAAPYSYPLNSPKIGTANYNRIKYYNALKANQIRETGIRDQFLEIPLHLWAGMNSGKHGSFTTVFSCWNAMAGTGIVTMPWAFQQSGIFLGVILTFVAFVISYYTCYLVIKTAGEDIDYTVTLRKHFGKPGWMFGMICFIVNLYVPILIFFQLLAQDLFPILLFLIEIFTGQNRQMTLTPDWSQFSYSWTCVIIFFIVFLMTASPNLQLFVKINSFGVIFIAIIILFICGMGFYAFSNTAFTYSESTFQNYIIEEAINPATSYLAYIGLFQKHFAPLMGILGGGFYFHNISLPVIRNNQNQENNARDVFAGYFCVFVTYCLAGILGYYGFVGSIFAAQEPSIKEIQQNCLNMFATKSIAGTFVRLCAFLQLLTVNSLLFACERSQILLLATGKQEASSQKINIMMNFFLIMPSFILAVYYPKVGSLAAILGSFGTMLCIYILPVSTYLKSLHSSIKTDKMSQLVDSEQLTSENLKQEIDKEQNDETTRKKKFYWMSFIGALIVVYGISVFVIQVI